MKGKILYCIKGIFVILIFCLTYPTLAATSGSVPVPMPVAKPPVANFIIPAAPDFDVKAFILIDANSGFSITEKNADLRLPPASITKLMTLFLVANALKSGQIHLSDMVTISENAWRKGGSRMFIKVGSQVSVQDLINGIAIASGNDATVAMAEYLAGTEENFVALMNQTAIKMGMQNTHFVDSNGLPEPSHYSSARDIAILARTWINTFPEYYPWFKQKWIMFNGIKQPNRNRLLWRDPSVDGIKTGHTDEAGYCLVVSGLRNGMRLISVVLGAKGDQARTNYTEALLNYGFRFYETRKLFTANTPLPNISAKVWLGKESHMPLGVARDLYATAPIGETKGLQANAKVTNNLRAPIAKGQVCGTINILQHDKVISSQPLIALNDNPKANFFVVLFDYIAMWLCKIF